MNHGSTVLCPNLTRNSKKTSLRIENAVKDKRCYIRNNRERPFKRF